MSCYLNILYTFYIGSGKVYELVLIKKCCKSRSKLFNKVGCALIRIHIGAILLKLIKQSGGGEILFLLSFHCNKRVTVSARLGLLLLWSLWLLLEKVPPYGQLFSSSCGELQPSAANSGALRPTFSKMFLRFFRNIFFKIYFFVQIFFG